jgi:hypothetical protein
MALERAWRARCPTRSDVGAANLPQPGRSAACCWGWGSLASHQPERNRRLRGVAPPVAALARLSAPGCGSLQPSCLLPVNRGNRWLRLLLPGFSVVAVGFYCRGCLLHCQKRGCPPMSIPPPPSPGALERSASIFVTSCLYLRLGLSMTRIGFTKADLPATCTTCTSTSELPFPVLIYLIVSCAVMPWMTLGIQVIHP